MLRLADEAGMFETGDNDGIDALLAASGKQAGFAVHEWERFQPRLALVVAAVIVSLALAWRYALPVMVELAVAITPPVVPQMMSAGTLRALDAAVFAPSKLEAAKQEELDEALSSLAVHSDLSPENLTLVFRASPRLGPNAFALPDGTVIMTDEMVELARGDVDALLGVLAHEIAHVEKEHSLRQFYNNAGLVALVMLVTGDIGPILEDTLVQGVAVLQLSYSRQYETQADRRSVELMAAAGREPAGLARLFAVIEKEFGLENERESWLSSHPATPGRREAISGYARELAR